MNRMLKQIFFLVFLTLLPLQLCIGQQSIVEKTARLATEGQKDTWITAYQQAFKENQSIADKDSMDKANYQLIQLFLNQYIQIFDASEKDLLDKFLTIAPDVNLIAIAFSSQIKKKINLNEVISHEKAHLELVHQLIEYGKRENAHTFLTRVYIGQAFLGYVEAFREKVDIGSSFEKACAQIPLAKNLPQYEAFSLQMEYANYLFGLEGDLEEALATYQGAMSFVGTNARGLLSVYMGMIRVLTSKGDSERAVDYVNQALNLKGEVKQISPFVQLHHLLTKNALETGNWMEAEEALTEAGSLLEQAMRNGGQSRFFFDINRHKTLQMQLKYHRKEKIELNSDMMNLAVDMGHAQFEYYEALIDHARLANDQTFFEGVEALFGEGAVQANPFFSLPQYNMILRAKGAFYAEQGQYQKAIESYNQAIQQLAGKPANDEMLLQFIREDQQALKILRAKLDAEMQLYQEDSTKVKLMDIYGTALQSITLLDRMRQQLSTKGARILLLQDAPLIFEQAIWVANQLYLKYEDDNFLQEAFAFAEKNKAVLLLDALKENKAKSFANIPEALQQKEQSLAYDINYYTAELSKAEEKGDSVKIQKFRQYLFDKRKALEQLKVSLEKDYPRYFQLKYESSPIQIKDLQELLQTAEMSLIEYAFTPNFLYIFIVNKDKVALSEIKLNKNFLSELNQFYLNLTDIEAASAENSLEELEKLAYSLFTQLIPTKWQVELPERLLIIPDGLLAYIPFEALVYKKEADLESYKSLNYCLHQSRMTYAYSATLWAESMQKKVNNLTKGVLAIAPEYNSALNGDKRGDKEWREIRALLPHLEGAEKEVNYLKQRFNGLFLKGDKANCKVFQQEAKKFAVIHLAMHGVVDKQNPAYSALFFSELSDSLEDDILFAYEIPSLQFDAELVVLSACQTGFGKYQNGEGVMSLGRSFMYAGASSLLLTLWDVNDASGAHLMEYFYDNLSKGMAKDDALQQAKVNYLEASDNLAGHPYFWSNYVLLGNNKKIQGLHPKSIITNEIWGIGGIIFLLLAIILFWTNRKNKT